MLSFNAGYIDTSGFLALQGLLTAHVTGNFRHFRRLAGTRYVRRCRKAACASGILLGGDRNTTPEFGPAATQAPCAEDHPRFESSSPDCRCGPCDPFWPFQQWRRLAVGIHRDGVGSSHGDSECHPSHPPWKRAALDADDWHDDANHDWTLQT